MQIGILGTGQVAQTLARRWAAAGHAIAFGSREPQAKTLDFPVTDLVTAVATADLAVNATPGSHSLEILTAIGRAVFGDKIVIDVANAITPAFELMYPNSSLAEQLQAALPAARIVKTMNTAAMAVMAYPSAIGLSSVFLSGDDASAKATVTALLADLGWPTDAIVDLGGIRSARRVEHYFLLFAALLQAKGSPLFNIRVV